jgi:hypothetical protein
MASIKGKYKELENGCWEWTGSRFVGGRPRAARQGPNAYAHRVSWREHFGEIPDGLWVCHRCNYKLCVNPSHLYLGDVKINSADAARDGLYRVGQKHGRAKLSDDEMKEIREMKGLCISQQAIADAYGVNQTQISRIWLGQTWARVK